MFSPCETDLATSYLQALCAAEGHGVPRKELARLYEGGATTAPDSLNSIELPASDLRNAIHTLQLLCLGRDGSQPWNGEMGYPSGELPVIGQQDEHLDPEHVSLVDLLSYADCHLTRSNFDTLEVSQKLSVSFLDSPESFVGYFLERTL